MSTWTSGGYPAVLEKIAEGKINLDADTITAHLTDTAPSTSHSELSDISEIETGGGYTQGTGLAVTTSSSAMDGTTYKLKLSGTIGFTATDTVNQFRYVVLCFSSMTDAPVFLYLELGEEVNLSVDDVLSVDVDGVEIFSISFG